METMNLQVIKHAQEFVWNIDEVKKALEDHIEKYRGLVVTDENLKEMEAAQGELASLRVKLDKFRVEVRKRMDEPYKKFESEVKELLALIQQAEKPLKEQIQKYEDERRQKRQAWVEGIIEGTCNRMGLREEFRTIAVQAKWLNRTSRDNDVIAEVTRAVSERLAEQQKADELEALRKQKASLIASLCQTFSVGLATPITPTDVYHLTCQAELADLPGIIQQYAEQQKAREVKAAEAAAVKAAEKVETVFPALPLTAAQAVEGLATAATQMNKVLPSATKFMSRDPNAYVIATIRIKTTRKEVHEIVQILKDGGIDVVSHIIEDVVA